MDVQAMISAIEEAARHMRGEVQLKTVEIIPTPVNVGGLRTSLGLSQSEFADRYGVHLRNLQRWESGEGRPDFYEETLLWHIQFDPGYVQRQFAEYCRPQSPVAQQLHPT